MRGSEAGSDRKRGGEVRRGLVDAAEVLQRGRHAGAKPGIAGLGGSGCFEFHEGAGERALLTKCLAEAVMRRGEMWIEFESALERDDGFVETTERAQFARNRRSEPGIARLQFCSGLEFGERLRVLALLSANLPEPVASRRKVGNAGEHAFEFADRRLEAADRLQLGGRRAPQPDIVRLDFEGGLKLGERRFVIAAQPADLTQTVPDVAIPRRQFDGAAIERKRVVIAPKRLQHRGGRGAIAGMARVRRDGGLERRQRVQPLAHLLPNNAKPKMGGRKLRVIGDDRPKARDRLFTPSQGVKLRGDRMSNRRVAGRRLRGGPKGGESLAAIAEGA